jgi:hypothetical protein
LGGDLDGAVAVNGPELVSGQLAELFAFDGYDHLLAALANLGARRSG